MISASNRPTAARIPIHDHTTQYHGFGYFEDILDEENRVALMLGSSVGKFQIPNLYGEEPSLGLDRRRRHPTFPSQDLNENQREVTAVRRRELAAFPGSARRADLVHRALFEPDLRAGSAGRSAVHAASRRTPSSRTSPMRRKATRLTAQRRRTRSAAACFCRRIIRSATRHSQVLRSTDAPEQQIGDVPATIVDNGSATEWIYSAYLQDEWKLLPDFTVNYGLRFDKFTAYTSAQQVSPRLNVVWQVLPDTTLHAGYSRYLSPPPFELVGGKDITLFENTILAAADPAAAPPQAEHANYYDAGVQQKIAHDFTVGLDTYYKQSANLIDEGQFGAPIILTPFNYRYGKQYGAEFTANYTTGNFNAYLNLAVQSAKGKQIDSAQFNFSPTDLDYIANNYIHLDHEQQHTASGGVSYLWRDTRFSADFLLGSGLRADLALAGRARRTATAARTFRTASTCRTTPRSTPGSHVFNIPSAGTLTARFDVINVFDKIYEIRNGTGVGVGAPQFGPRRGFFFGLSKSLGPVTIEARCARQRAFAAPTQARRYSPDLNCSQAREKARVSSGA